MIAAWIGTLALLVQALALGIGGGLVLRSMRGWWWILPVGGMVAYVLISTHWPPIPVRMIQAARPYALSDALRGLLLIAVNVGTLWLLGWAVRQQRRRADRAERERDRLKGEA